MSGERKCPACSHTAQPVFGLWDSGQLGPQCARCQTVLGDAATPPMPAAMVRDDKYRAVAAPVSVTVSAADAPNIHRAAPRTIAKPSVRPGRQARPEPADGADDLEILRARLDEIIVEAAHIRVEVCRLRGLEVEEKHLRREIARVEDTRMKDRVRSAAQTELPLVNGVSGPTITDIRN